VIGSTIGDYRIIEKRGEGGMGMFFKAQDIRLDRFVGIKTIRAELLHEPEILAKLEEEAKSLARLDHPNIARLLHYMVINDLRYIVMEYVEGADLAERLRSGGPLPLELVVQLVPQICSAIGYAHDRGVIHRDIKPSNILMTSDNTAKVTDFGIAKILGVSTKTKTGVATGSLPYMAPEQIRGTGVDARTDIYQLGVMFFELLVGRRPFLAETEYDMMSHHLSTPPPEPSSIDPKLPKSVDRVLLKALAKDPAARYGSAKEFATAFRNAALNVDDSRTVYQVDGAATRPHGVEPHPKRNWFRLVGGIVIGIAVLALMAKLFLFDQGGNGSSIAALAEVSVSAKMPNHIQSHPKVSERLTVRYLGPGTGRQIFVGDQRDLNPPTNDSLTLATTRALGPGDDFTLFLWMAPAESVQFHLEVTEPSGKLICDGTRIIRIENGLTSALRLEIPMTAAPIAEDENPVVQAAPTRDSQATTSVVPPAPEVTIEPARQPAPNLTIDVQPFAERDRIESIWLDGEKQTGSFPLSLNAPKGLRTIRWSVGTDYWTDTVTVANTPVEKNLMFAMSRGRLNVTVTFSDGPGYAEILLDGQETGLGTPGELRDIAAGPHEITLRRAGYKMQGGPYVVRVPANDRARVNITMAPR
jgi:serine/threonine-protein kinase